MPDQDAQVYPQGNDVWANAAARRLAERLNLSADKVVGTGDSGARTVKDIRGYLEQKYRDDTIEVAGELLGEIQDWPDHANELAKPIVDALENILPSAYAVDPKQHQPIIDLHDKLTEALKGPYDRQDLARRFASTRSPSFEKTVPRHPNPKDPNNPTESEQRPPDRPPKEPRRLPIRMGNGTAGGI